MALQPPISLTPDDVALRDHASDRVTPSGGGRHRTRLLIAGAFVAVLVVALVVAKVWPTSEGSATTATTSTLDAPTRNAINDAVTKAEAAKGLSPAQVYQHIHPSLVFIQVEETGQSGSNAGDKGTGLGSGIVVNADGTILTALHVVKDTASINVVFADGTKSTATIASSDPANDIATLTPATLPSVVVPAVLGGGVAVGDSVVAVGHPLGLIDTTTAGVVSGLDRSITESDTKVNGLIQFDAAVNPGSSGVPLLNSLGQTIGIVVALADPSEKGFFIGIGFAVPVGAAVGGGGNGPQK